MSYRIDQEISFLNSHHTNTWLYSDDKEVYVRKSKRLYKNEWFTCFDIASITVYTQAQGTFSAYFDALIEGMRGRVDALYFECVLNVHMPKALRQRGCVEVESWYEKNFFYFL